MSACALAALIAVQGALFFSQHIEESRNPVQTTVHRLSLSADGRQAGVLLLHVPRTALHAPSNTVGVWDIADSGCSVRKCPLDSSPFNAVLSRTGRRLFASSNDGQLSVCDLPSPASRPRLLGTHDEGFMHTLECTYDGSIVVATNRRILGAWSPDTSECLWRRNDLDLLCACFWGKTNRLFCGLSGGAGCELNGLTGDTLRTFPTHCDLVVSIDVSADGSLLAALNHDGALVVADLATNQPLWRRKFPPPAAKPRFSPDGQLVLTPADSRKPSLLVLTAATGEQRCELKGAKAEIAGIAVSENGVVYAWDTSGAITSWNLSSGALLRQIGVECLLANMRS